MNICVIGKHLYPVNLLDDQLNSKTWLAISKYMEKIDIIALSPDKRFHTSTYENINLHLLPKFNGFLETFLFIILAIWTGLRLHFRGSIDIWEISEPTSGGIAGIVLKILTMKKMLLHLQGELLNLPTSRFCYYKRKGIRFVTMIVCQFSDKIRALSKKINAQLLDTGIEENKIVTIPSRCDVNLFDPNRWKESRVKLREDLGYIDNKLIIFIGRLHEQKGLKYALSALPEIHAKYSNIRFLIIGDGELREDLEKLALDLKISNLVRFYGSIPYTKVPEFLSIGDIFLHPSMDEGMPRSVLEALSMELPVIATEVSGTEEIVKNGDTGILIRLQSSKQISKAVASLLEDYSFARGLGKNGRDLVVKSYSFDRGIQRLVDLHIDLVPSRSKT